ncbi:hypothetical protein O181_005710 [Austropuccinia psidii MF-1]|uniref:Uncharacterized protein n=1 Tax=Austropuccinia psidii MF-1 TaxID=1389203 RepID=A0A9Q3BIW9_9BASI|nr:hypothetical protein [Austropuccinia psidii MF-1]
MVDGRKLKEIMTMMPFTFQFNRNLKIEDWKDMDQVLQLHQLLKDIFQWSMDNKGFNLASNYAELSKGSQKIFLEELPFKTLIVIIKFGIPIGSSNSWRKGKPR